MGRVYKVLDTKINEKIALKLIKAEVASDRETIERFSNELKLARKIRHKNVCGMFDIGEAEGAHFITMEYVSGEDLKTMIRMSTGLTMGTVLTIGKQVCQGLAEAHSLGVVHWDLKPQNIMIDRGGNAKIMDFGIARSVREKGITGAGVMIGTPEYMSPEQTEAKDVDQRSDIYSLGIILYEMATGRVPFEGETALSVAIKHKTEIPKDPKSLNTHIPGDLDRLILKCLEKGRAARYQTAGDVETELEKIEKGIPTTERVAPERKTLTSKQITVQFEPKRIIKPAAILSLSPRCSLRFLPRKKQRHQDRTHRSSALKIRPATKPSIISGRPSPAFSSPAWSRGAGCTWSPGREWPTSSRRWAKRMRKPSTANRASGSAARKESEPSSWEASSRPETCSRRTSRFWMSRPERCSIAPAPEARERTAS
jgi:serine/threonine protein kinase